MPAVGKIAVKGYLNTNKQLQNLLSELAQPV